MTPEPVGDYQRVCWPVLAINLILSRHQRHRTYYWRYNLYVIPHYFNIINKIIKNRADGWKQNVINSNCTYFGPDM